MTDTETNLSEFDGAMKSLRTFREFKIFQKWLADQEQGAINKMLGGRKEESMRELAKEVKTYRKILNLFK